MMKVIIIEDEKPSARRLHRLLKDMDIEPLEMLHSVEESIIWFSENKHPDLIFLDIQLSDGLSFEIFENVEINSAVIFTTAFDEYALRAFKLNSIDYLLKPIDEEELQNAVKKYQDQIGNNRMVNMDFDEVKKLLVNPIDRNYKKRFSVKIGQRLKLINTEDIECFYSENKGTYAFTVDGRNYLIDTTLELLSDELDPDQYFRVNRTYFVNINAIRDMVSYTNSRIQVSLNSFDKDPIIVARERVKDFKDWLE